MDQMKYMNSYVDTLMSMIHEQIVTIAGNKTEARILNDKVTDLTNENNQLRYALEEINNRLNACESDKQASTVAVNQELANTSNELNSLRNQVTSMTAEINTLRSKASHVDGLTNQITAMKNIIIDKDETINKLLEEKKPKKPRKPKEVTVEPESF